MSWLRKYASPAVWLTVREGQVKKTQTHGQMQKQEQICGDEEMEKDGDINIDL